MAYLQGVMSFRGGAHPDVHTAMKWYAAFVILSREKRSYSRCT